MIKYLDAVRMLCSIFDLLSWATRNMKQENQGLCWKLNAKFMFFSLYCLIINPICIHWYQRMGFMVMDFYCKIQESECAMQYCHWSRPPRCQRSYSCCSILLLFSSTAGHRRHNYATNTSRHCIGKTTIFASQLKCIPKCYCTSVLTIETNSRSNSILN